jgi:hypothetical protein
MDWANLTVPRSIKTHVDQAGDTLWKFPLNLIHRLRRLSLKIIWIRQSISMWDRINHALMSLIDTKELYH